MFNPIDGGDSSELSSHLRSASDLLLDEKASVHVMIYQDILNYENHYNMIQNKYKALAATWVMAAFVGIGYLMRGYESKLSIDLYLIIAFLSLISALGIFLLWYLDSGVYYKLIEIIFEAGLELEKKNSYLGKFHENLLQLHVSQKEPRIFHGFYYSSFVFTFLLITGLSIISYLLEMDDKFQFLMMGVATVITFFVVRFLIYKIRAL